MSAAGGRLNRAWHAAHRMPAQPSLDERIRWHIAHAKACGCRDMPQTIAAEIARRRRPARTRPGRSPR